MYETAIMGHLLVGLRSVLHSVILKSERERERQRERDRDKERDRERERQTDRERGIYTILMVHSKT